MERKSRLVLDNDKTNALIYKLIRTFEAMGEEWIDDLPVSLTAPYSYAEDSDTEISRLKKRVGVNEYATAENCMDWIYRECGIKKYRDNDGNCTHCGEPYDECVYEEYPEEYARKIAGVRYSMLSKDFSAYNTQYTFEMCIRDRCGNMPSPVFPARKTGRVCAVPKGPLRTKAA